MREGRGQVERLEVPPVQPDLAADRDRHLCHALGVVRVVRVVPVDDLYEGGHQVPQQRLVASLRALQPGDVAEDQQQRAVELADAGDGDEARVINAVGGAQPKRHDPMRAVPGLSRLANPGG